MSGNVLLEYIGRQLRRVDDVLHTKRIWDAAGSVLEVPENEALHYLQHPTEWRVVSREQVNNRLAARQAVEVSMSQVKSQWESLTIADLEQLRGDIDARIAILRAEADALAKAVATAPPADFVVDTSTGNAGSNDIAIRRTKEIIAAIGELDPNDPDHYAKHPKKMPRVDAVSERVGFKVTGKEVSDAMDLMKAA